MKAENKLGKIPLHGRNLTQPSKGGSLRWSKGVLTIEEQRAKHGDTYDSDPVIYINKPSNMVAESPIRGKESNWTDESESQSESSGQYSKESRTGLDITSRKVKLETENSLEANEGKLGNGEELGVDDSLAGLNIPQNLPSNDNSSGDESK